jgi:hypothetical protein
MPPEAILGISLSEKRTIKKSNHSEKFGELLNQLLKVMEEEHAKLEEYELCAKLRDAQLTDEITIEWNSLGEVVAITPATKKSK